LLCINKRGDKFVGDDNLGFDKKSIRN
jgi:hypothetical protein